MGSDPTLRIEKSRRTIMKLLEDIATILLGGFFISFSSFASSGVVIVIPGGDNEFKSIALEIKQLIDDSSITILESDRLIDFPEKTELIITLGNESCHKVEERVKGADIPVINSFISRSHWEKRKSKLAILNDINIKIQVELVSLLFDNRPVNVGIFIPDSDSYFEKEILKLNKHPHVKIVARKISEDENPAKVIGTFVNQNAIDAFILLPSKEIFNPHSVSAVLYELYRHRVAAIVSSPQLVANGVGGVAGAYFTREQVIAETREQVEKFLVTKSIAQDAKTPRIANVAFNEKLIKALDLNQLDISRTRLLIDEQ